MYISFIINFENKFILKLILFTFPILTYLQQHIPLNK